MIYSCIVISLSSFTVEAQDLHYAIITMAIYTKMIFTYIYFVPAINIITIITAGTILLEDKPVSSEKLNRNCSYLFQNPDYQLFLPTARAELEYGLKLQKMDSCGIEKRVQEAIKIFGIEHPDAPPVLMSYGQRKKMQAAIYWLLNKKIVIIDEADSGISSKEYRQIIEAFRQSPANPAILIITHDIQLAALEADKIFRMGAL